MGTKVTFGIVGTGAIAVQHAAAIQELSSADLVAVCSSNDARAILAQDKFQVKAYSNLEVFLGHPGMDVVCVCTASGHHRDVAIQAAKAGKHVLVEKPIEINKERADQMIQACQDHGVKLGVVFQNRFNEGYLLLKNAVRKGALGRLLMGNAYIKWFRDENYYKSSHWKGTLDGDGGGALINQGIHTIDLLLDIMGEAESVYGQVKTTLHEIEGEDLGTAVVNFKNGALGNITAGTSLYPGYPERLEIYGTKGSVILEAGEIVAWNIKGEESPVQKSAEKRKSGAADPLAIGHRLHLLQIEDMVLAVRDGKSPLVSGEESKQSLAVIQGIYQSSREERKVLL